MDESMKVGLVVTPFEFTTQIGVAYSLENVDGTARKRHGVRFAKNRPWEAVKALRELADHLERQLV